MRQGNIASTTSVFFGLLIITSLLLPAPAMAAKFSIVVLPDTQNYSQHNPHIFQWQTQWIVENKDDENIIYVAHLGDLKDSPRCEVASTVPGRDEWDEASDAMALLEDPMTTGLPDGIPYGVVPGNHDFDPLPSGRCPIDNPSRTLGKYNQVNPPDPVTYFHPSRFSGRDYYGGSFTPGSNENNYTLFEFNGIEFIAINLTYRENSPSVENPDTFVDPILERAKTLLEDNPDKMGIVTSHYILDTPTSEDPPNFGPYGTRIYDKLKGEPNLFLMLSGHRRGEAWRTEARTGMNPVQILMSNYQDYKYSASPDYNDVTQCGNCGDSGFMRIMRFDACTRKVNVETFFPRDLTPSDSMDKLQKVLSTRTEPDGSKMDKSTASNFEFDFTGIRCPPMPQESGPPIPPRLTRPFQD